MLELSKAESCWCNVIRKGVEIKDWLSSRLNRGFWVWFINSWVDIILYLEVLCLVLNVGDPHIPVLPGAQLGNRRRR